MSQGVNGRGGPLEGIRVIDWTIWQLGPVSTMMLADLGAEVIKVETLDGEQAREFHRVVGPSTSLPGGLNAYFLSLNRQKKSIALDLKNPKGVEVMHDLVRQSDIFVQNFRQGVAERLGLGYEELSKINPRIIYAAGSGYGPKGPDSGKSAMAFTGEARSGSLWWAGPDDGIPYDLRYIADQMAGIMLSYGILGALHARDRLGKGQKVDVSHLGSMMWLGGVRYGMALLTGNEHQRESRDMMRNPLWNCYKCKDDRWIAFSMNRSDRYWPSFCDALEIGDIATDERYRDTEARAENRKALIELLDGVFLTKTLEEWIQVFENRAKDIIWERVQTVGDLPNDPQVVDNEYIVDFDHPVLGPTKWIQTPVTYSDTPVSTRKMAPELGEDTDEILTEVLGYTSEQITDLREAGATL